MTDEWNRPLLNVDRCDRCGSQAYHRATLPQGTELLFCAHHGRDHLDVLIEKYPGTQVFSDLESLDRVVGVGER